MDGAQQLGVTIRRGQLEGQGGVRSLLDAGVSSSEEMRPIGTPLMFATLQGHVDIMELLVERGANVDAPTPSEDIHPKGWRALLVTISADKGTHQDRVRTKLSASSAEHIPIVASRAKSSLSLHTDGVEVNPASAKFLSRPRGLSV